MCFKRICEFGTEEIFEIKLRSHQWQNIICRGKKLENQKLLLRLHVKLFQSTYWKYSKKWIITNKKEKLCMHQLIKTIWNTQQRNSSNRFSFSLSPYRGWKVFDEEYNKTHVFRWLICICLTLCSLWRSCLAFKNKLFVFSFLP